MITKDDELFEGTSFSSLMNDIYINAGKKRKQIEILTNELRPFITDASNAIMIVPLIKEYLEVGVKNDEQLVKMANVVQKFMQSENNGKANPAGDGIMTEKEREQLLEEVAVIKKETAILKNDEAKIEQNFGELIAQTKDAVNKISEHSPIETIIEEVK